MQHFKSFSDLATANNTIPYSPLTDDSTDSVLDNAAVYVDKNTGKELPETAMTGEQKKVKAEMDIAEKAADKASEQFQQLVKIEKESKRQIEAKYQGKEIDTEYTELMAQCDQKIVKAYQEYLQAIGTQRRIFEKNEQKMEEANETAPQQAIYKKSDSPVLAKIEHQGDISEHPAYSSEEKQAAQKLAEDINYANEIVKRLEQNRTSVNH